MTVEIVSAYVTKNQVGADGIESLIGRTGAILSSLARGEAPGAEAAQEPAVPISESVTPDHIICLENGKKFKMLRRHLSQVYGLTPDAYRRKWGLPEDYPMVAPEYARRRSEFARNSGLGKR
ncbi:MAG: MucR family transcriptional regulator [Minwuia sp.]|nr:MucR family transcriptional regulator [Minwuia sp.]